MRLTRSSQKRQQLHQHRDPFSREQGEQRPGKYAGSWRKTGVEDKIPGSAGGRSMSAGKWNRVEPYCYSRYHPRCARGLSVARRGMVGLVGVVALEREPLNDRAIIMFHDGRSGPGRLSEEHVGTRRV